MLNVLTIDVEEYFHATEVQTSLGQSQWRSLDSRIEDQTRKTLEILDNKKVKGTFFILGWVAEHKPSVVRAILAAGHEIGCHSHAHRLVYDLTPAEFRRDTLRAVAAIEDSCGIRPQVYRAPSYSITRSSLWALEVLVECGFTHDSSIYPISHDRYGIPGFNRHAHLIQTPSGPITEVPIATAKLGDDRVVPVGGGGYMRLLPYRYTAAGIRRINSQEQVPACIYFHPWELDPEQPRLELGFVSRLRTYGGLGSMQGKLERLLDEFHFSTMLALYPVQTGDPELHVAC